MGLLDAQAITPLSIPVVGSERRNATHTASGLARLDWPRSVDRGRADGVALTRARSSRRDDMADVDRAAQDPARGKERPRQACHPVLSTSATSVWRARESSSSSKPEKARAVLLASASSAQPSCGALVELLVCGTASHENQYGPCETPVQNEAAMPFLEQNKPPGC